MSNLVIGDSSSAENAARETTTLLERSLQHGNANVKLLGLNEIERQSTTTSNNTQFEANICIALIACLASDNESVGAAAVRILQKILPHFLAANHQWVRASLDNVLATTSDMTRCRCYEVAIYIGKESERSLQIVQFILDRLIGDSMSDYDDILMLSNVMAFLADLAGTPHGCSYLENRGIFEQTSKRFQHIILNEATPFRDLLIPTYMNFFGSAGGTKPSELLSKCPGMIDSIFAYFWQDNSSALASAYDTLGKL